jgi:hypothetical protein
VSERAAAISPLTIRGAVVFAIAAMLYLFDPRMAHIYPPCPLHFLTGLYCPGCGSLRATHLLLHGNVAQAFAMNPLLLVAFPAAVLLKLKSSWAYRPWVAWLSFSTLLLFGVLRNLPYWPFCVLAPR